MTSKLSNMETTTTSLTMSPSCTCHWPQCRLLQERLAQLCQTAGQDHPAQGLVQLGSTPEWIAMEGTLPASMANQFIAGLHFPRLLCTCPWVMELFATKTRNQKETAANKVTQGKLPSTASNGKVTTTTTATGSAIPWEQMQPQEVEEYLDCLSDALAFGGKGSAETTMTGAKIMVDLTDDDSVWTIASTLDEEEGHPTTPTCNDKTIQKDLVVVSNNKFTNVPATIGSQSPQKEAPNAALVSPTDDKPSPRTVCVDETATDSIGSMDRDQNDSFLGLLLLGEASRNIEAQDLDTVRQLPKVFQKAEVDSIDNEQRRLNKAALEEARLGRLPWLAKGAAASVQDASNALRLFSSATSDASRKEKRARKTRKPKAPSRKFVSTSRTPERLGTQDCLVSLLPTGIQACPCGTSSTTRSGSTLDVLKNRCQGLKNADIDHLGMMSALVKGRLCTRYSWDGGCQVWRSNNCLWIYQGQCPACRQEAAAVSLGQVITRR